MEFTVNGTVRQAFGFSNPNHAAALLCALIPLCWGWRKCAKFGYALSVLLIAPLAMTFSRTGAIVLAFECVAYLLLSHKYQWKKICLFAFVGILVFALVGIQSRFALDKAVTNRPEIWVAGLKLAAANPLGVGLGNSGKIASAFLLDGITVRTLVNSHLTLLCEFGIPAALLWFLFLFHALANGFGRMHSVWCSFAGLCLSASSSSVFDWPVLLDFSGHGGLPIANHLLSWATLLLFLAMGARLCLGRFRVARLLGSACLAIAASLAPLAFYAKATPRFKDGLVMLNPWGRGKCLLLYDRAWSMSDARAFAAPGTCSLIPVDSCENVVPGLLPEAERVILFGECASLAHAFPEAELVLVSPPWHFPLPPNARKVYLRRHVEERPAGNVETVFF